MEPNEKSSLGLEANVAAGLSLILGWLTGLIFFFIETQSKFAKFNAMQILLLSGALIVLWTALGIFSVIMGFISGICSMLIGLGMTLLSLGVFGLWIVMLIFAFQGKMFKLPIIGQMAEDIAVKSLSSSNTP